MLEIIGTTSSLCLYDSLPGEGVQYDPGRRGEDLVWCNE